MSTDIPQTDTPQSNFQDDQNFDPDIPQMYKDFVTGGATPSDSEPGENIGIDDLRGQISISVTGQTTKNLITSLNISPTSTKPSNSPNTATPVQLAQESRCHTFYRIIGFPVVNKDKTDFYNPGLDVVKQAGVPRNISLEKKIQIASNIDPKFESLSQAREVYANNTAQVFSVPESVEAGVLALMSGTSGENGSTNIRSFTSDTFKNGDDAFDFEKNNQSNPISIFSAVTLVEDREVFLADFQDPGADPSLSFKPNAGVTNPSVLRQHFHIIKPFMVDPRIDFSIWSDKSKTSINTSRRVAVPFVPDATFLKANSTSFAERPLIEKIITERFSQFNNTTDAGQATEDLVNYVKDIKSIQSVKIGTVSVSEIFSNKIFKLSEQSVFAQYLSIIQAMMFKLVKSIHTIQTAQSQYYWLPRPSNLGPEAGCAVREVPLNQNIDSTLITKKDFNIIYNKTQVAFSNITSSSSQANTSPDRGGYAFNAFFNHKLTFNHSTSQSQGDLSSNTMNTMASQRNKVLGDAGKALQIVEMIMGEYSGLGLCDIVAIVGSLYIMPKRDLLGLLDRDAIVRAEAILGQSLQSQRNESIQDVLDSLTKTVKGYYQIMDKVFQDFLNNNNITT